MYWSFFAQSNWFLAFITSHKLVIQKLKESVSRVEMYKAQTTDQLSISTKPWLLWCLPLCLWLAFYSSSSNNLISYESLKPGVVAHSCNPRIYEAEAGGLRKSSRPTEAIVKFCFKKKSWQLQDGCSWDDHMQRIKPDSERQFLRFIIL